jgi:hypothetical protein
MNKKTKNKKYIIMILIVTSFTILVQTVNAWDNCPFGETNDTYPGNCGRYIDIDGDNICDLSQSSPEERELKTDDNTKDSSISSNVNSESNVNNKSGGINYYFIPIAIILFILYMISLTLSKKKKIKPSQHRKIWNFLLLITFLVSGVFGIILAIIISYGIRLTYYSDMLFWHVEMGIAMAMISIFHILWHLKYFKKMFQIKK